MLVGASLEATASAAIATTTTAAETTATAATTTTGAWFLWLGFINSQGTSVHL
jgi:hypothetical protein